MNITDFLSWLDSYLNFERTPQKNIFWLDTMRFLCDRLGLPQDNAPCVHVAGSKGKGSVSKMISCILSEAGYSVGLYSSPHIADFRERISAPGGFFPDDVYSSAADELVALVDSVAPADFSLGRPLTWFELVTAYAFLCFRRAHTDWNVFEVGLGGRLDSTNVITPRLCCITPIELEHTEFLGNTTEKIAAEKAGIIKNGIPVLISAQKTDSVRDVFAKKAKKCESSYYFVDNLIKSMSFTFDSSARKMTVRLESGLFSRPVCARLGLLGRMQAENAALAALAAKLLFPSLDEAVIERGLSCASLPGRFEIVSDFAGTGVTVILDGAHTPNSIRLALETLDGVFPGKKTSLLFACAADKDVTDIAPLFRGRFSRIFVTRPGERKRSDLQAEANAFMDAGLSFAADADCPRAIQGALRQCAEDGSLLLVTGSFYLLAELALLRT